MAHSKEYIEALERLDFKNETETLYFSDTYLNKNSLSSAKIAVGGIVLAVDKLYSKEY